MFKIKVYDTWIEVTEWIFRSFTGERLLNDKPYHGEVFYLGTDRLARKAA